MSDTNDGAIDAPGPAGGAARRRRAQGPKSEVLRTIGATYDADVSRYIDEFIFGEIWGRPGLSQDERMLAAIAALAATGHPNQLSNYLWGALHAGMSAIKIQEVLMMMPVYAGFPTAMDALALWTNIRRKARQQGLELDLDEPDST